MGFKADAASFHDNMEYSRFIRFSFISCYLHVPALPAPHQGNRRTFAQTASAAPEFQQQKLVGKKDAADLTGSEKRDVINLA